MDHNIEILIKNADVMRYLLDEIVYILDDRNPETARISHAKEFLDEEHLYTQVQACREAFRNIANFRTDSALERSVS